MTGSWLCESRKFPPFQPYDPTALHDDCHASDWVIALVTDRKLSKKVNLCAHATLVRRWNARPRMEGRTSCDSRSYIKVTHHEYPFARGKVTHHEYHLLGCCH